MKIALDVSQSIYGTGVSDYTLELYKHLEGVLPFGYSFRRYSELKRTVLKGVSLPFPPTLMHYLWNKLHIINVETFVGKIDIYHSSDWAQGPSRAGKVTTIHDLSPFLFPQEANPKIVSVHTDRMKWVVKECHKIICVSQNTANDMSKLFPETSSRLVVIPEAMPSRFLLKPSSSYTYSYILAVGTRQPRKNITRLISAFLKYRLSEKLIIIGEKPDHLEGGQLALSAVEGDSFQVEFTGYVSDQELVNYLASASCFVYPSLYEGFGLPILSAFHHKVPVACSNTSSLPEVAGNAAAFFNPQDAESIAHGISAAIKNKKSLIAAGTKQLSKFSWSHTAAETMKVYKSLC
ncbi:glycosyltransferase family 4 protein [Candidatus Amesbacteria bacterium]|nr:glycosyltransferase family 4 protein [Candidatus Amesbacteria bacterium]